MERKKEKIAADKPIGMPIIDMEEIIPQEHLLIKIGYPIGFELIHEIQACGYPPIGLPSVDPASMFKMPSIGDLYGLWQINLLSWQFHLRFIE